MRFFALLLLFTCLFSGCNRKSLAELCADRFPQRTDTLVNERTVRLVDTLLIPDTIVDTIVSVECPPGLTEPTLVTDTFRLYLPGRTEVIEREVQCLDTIIEYRDAELVAGLKNRTEELREDLARVKGKRDTLRWLVIGLAVILLAGIGLAVWQRKRKT